MLRRAVLVLLVALFAVGEMSASIAFAQDATQQQPQKKRRTLFDMLFGGGDQQEVLPPAPVVTKPKKAALPAPVKPAVEKAATATRLAVFGDSMATDLAKNSEQRNILEYIFAEQIMGKPFMFAEGVPAERVAAMRKAFMQTAQDKTALDQMNAQSLDVTAVSGEEMETIVAKMIATPPDLVQRAREAMEQSK